MSQSFKPSCRRPLSRAIKALSAILAALAVAVPTLAEARPLDDASFARIVEALEAKRVERHIPGMVLAIVTRDGGSRVHAFGERDIERHLPVEADTLFGIASTSKTFTATLAAIVAAEGSMTFDDPVRKHLPWFALSDATASEACTLRDLMCHRTGLTRTDALMMAQGMPHRVTRRELVEQLAKAELFRPFRSTFQYNNQMFLVAGLATAAATGHPEENGWDSLLEARLFVPLGMTHTTASHVKALADPALSMGYRWDDASARFTPAPTSGFDLAAPAGGIYSTGNDMARWLSMLVNRGTVDGRVIVSEGQLDELWKPQIEMVPGSGLGYGLGFMTQTWNGHRVIKHGGNLDGFNTQLALLPDDGAGFVLLTNNFATALPEEAIDIVFRAITTPLVDGPVPADVAPLLGCYEFAPAHATWTVVHLGGGTLGLDVPNQRVYTLAKADADGMRTLIELPVAKMRFDRAPDGAVTQASFVQSRRTFALPRLGDKACADATAAQKKPILSEGLAIPATKLDSYTGTYRFAEAKQDWEVLINARGELAVDVPGQTVYALKWPNADGHWVFKLTDTIEVSFATRTIADAQRVEETIVDSMTLHQAGQSIVMRRALPLADLPGIDDVLALVRKANPAAANDRIATLRATGTLRMPHQGLDGTIKILAAGRDRLVVRTDFGRFGFVEMGMTSGSGWSNSSMTPTRELVASEIDELRRQHPLAEFEDWSTRYSTKRVIGTKTVGNIETIVVRVRTQRGQASTKFIDKTTGDVVREEGAIDVAGVMSLPFTMTFADFRDVAGSRVPFRITNENDANGRIEIVLDAIETGIEVQDSAFLAPASVSAP